MAFVPPTVPGRSMLAFFRRILSSWVAVALLGLIMIAFIVTGVGTPGGGLVGGMSGDAVATVGGKPVTIQDIQGRAQAAYNQARQQQPGLTMAALISAIGGAEPLIQQFIGARVLSAWAERHGVSVSERLIGGEVASIPAFQGPTGAFDQQRMNAVLSQQRMTFPALHDGIRDDLLRRQLLAPISLGINAPRALLEPYAQLLLARREGMIGFVPANPAGLAAPTEAEVAAWYKANAARYSLPERRVIRYALIGPESAAAPAPTEAEIAAAYKADASKYAASETRSVSQVVLPDQAAANAFVANANGAGGFAKAAADAGFAAKDISLGTLTRAALAGTSSAAVADAAFGAKAGGSAGPIKTDLGYSIVHVDAVTATPARSLDQVRSEITAALAKRKGAEAAANLVQAVGDQVTDGANFNQVAKKHKLQVVTTPALLANGSAPTDPVFKPDATLTALLRVANQMSADDEPSVEQLDANQHYALVGVASVVPAAPVPLAQIRPRVVQDLLARRLTDRARATAQAVVAKVRGGQPMPAAFAAANLPAPKPASGSQVDLARAGPQVPAPLRALFRLTPGTVDLVPGEGGGWYVVRLDRIIPGDNAALPAIVAATRSEMVRNLGEEYAEQFANAARGEVKVKRNAAAQAKLEAQLRGTAPADAGQ